MKTNKITFRSPASLRGKIKVYLGTLHTGTSLRGKTKVYLGTTHTGTIRPVLGGYQYFPLGKDQGGQVFPDLESCKRSLMED